jgi:hypothetical protein
MASGKAAGTPKGIVETTLAGINPQDRDYGRTIEDWRKEIFENTLERGYFWALLMVGAGFSVSLVGNGWLLRERERRLVLSADVVTQLYNAYVGSRVKASEVIAKYNRLVDRYNRLDGENQQLAQRTAGDSAKVDQAELDFNQAREDRGASSLPRCVTRSSAQETLPSHEAELAEIGTLKAHLAEFETKLQRKTAQLQAKDNQITNLRERLNRAHDNLEGQRKTPAV